MENTATDRSTVRKLRELYDVTQADVAKKAGISDSKLSLYEGGFVDLAGKELEQLEKALNILAKVNRDMPGFKSVLDGTFDQKYASWSDKKRIKARRSLRRQAKLTQIELAREIGVPRKKLIHWEAGRLEFSDAEFAKWQEALSARVRLAGALQGGVSYLGIERQYGANVREKLKGERELIEHLRASAAIDFPKIKTWLDVEMEIARLTEKAMNLAELAHDDFDKTAVLADVEIPGGKTVLGKIEESELFETMRLLAVTKTVEGKIAPWQRKKMSKPEDAGRFQICIANNPKEEAELLAAGWQVVKSE